MSANVFTFPGRSKGPQPWTNDELAELYRVVDLLGKAGLAVVTDMGMSDEGDPWFVFCRADNEEVIAHFARIDGHFVAASIAVDETFRGANFRQIVDRMVSSQPLVVPKPGTGSRLFLHPAVLLTAFVATALAHSEKMLAQDFIRAVEAQWDHAKSAALNEIKHVKTGWLDTLHSLLKLPLHESRLAHDSVKETQALTLASMIAIAMTALQPIVDKIALITQVIADEFPGHGGGAGQSHSAHAAQLALDAAVADLAAQGGNHGNGHAHAGDDAPQSHKGAVPPSDGGDGQKMADGSHALGAPAVQKAALDEVAHVPVHAADPADVNGALLMLQKVAAAAAAPVMPAQALEIPAIHVDMGNSPIQPITLQDVTPEALQILSIHVTKPDAATVAKPDVTPVPASTETASTAPPAAPASAPAPSPSPTVADSGTTTHASGGDSVVVAPAPSPVQTASTGPQEVSGAVGQVEIDAISNFVTSGTHTIAQPSAMNFSAGLQQELSGYFGSGNSLKIVVFDTTLPVADIFSFSPGVVFVADRDFTPNAILYNHGGNLTLDLTGGTMTLVGVVTIEHAAV